jgi:hypothetical protein
VRARVALAVAAAVLSVLRAVKEAGLKKQSCGKGGEAREGAFWIYLKLGYLGTFDYPSRVRFTPFVKKSYHVIRNVFRKQVALYY